MTQRKIEESWVSHIRSIAKKQQTSAIDAIVDQKNHLLLKTVDGSDIDAGLVREKPHGPVVYFAYDVIEDEPDIYLTRDGALWEASPSELRFSDGSSYRPQAGCWTGDQYLVGSTRYRGDIYALLLQSRDGGTWSYHPDPIFNQPGSLEINGIDSDRNGFVVIVGDPYFGPDGNRNIVLSYDFGETWELYEESPNFPYDSYTIYSVSVKNSQEWVISDNSSWWYTFDGGAHWSEVILPLGAMSENMGIIWFNECWWVYGQYFYSPSWDDPAFWGIDDLPAEWYEWNTVLIKSDDLVNWQSVTTPWNGNYPVLDDYEPRPVPIGHRPGLIWNLEADPLTNTMIANGETPYNQSMVMMSTDGGDNWFEIGYVSDQAFKTDHNWDGIYNWSDDMFFANSGGMAYGYGWWFVVNNYGSPGQFYPPIVRISPDGKISEPVYPPQQSYMQGRIILSGEDIT